jgi:hypothetical protein
MRDEVERLALRSSEEVPSIGLQYFPVDRLAVRVRLLLEEMLDGSQ